MTAQINDSCFHRKIDYSIAGISGTGLFDPTDLGLRPLGLNTACWRGYVAGYSVVGDELLLSRLQIGLEGEDVQRAVELFGAHKGKDFCGLVFQDLTRPVPFTGGLLLADGFIRELYVHMGFHPAWKYERVRELSFHEGRVIADEDRSEQMAGVREKIIATSPLKPNPAATRDEVEGWIEDCFSRKY